MNRLRYIKLDFKSRISQNLKIQHTITREVVFNGETWNYIYYPGSKGIPVLFKKSEVKQDDGLIYVEEIRIVFDEESGKPDTGTIERYLLPKGKDIKWRDGIYEGLQEKFLIDEYWNKTIIEKKEYLNGKRVGESFKKFKCCLNPEYEGEWSNDGIPVGKHIVRIHSYYKKSCRNWDLYSLFRFNRDLIFKDGTNDYKEITYNTDDSGNLYVWSVGEYYNGNNEEGYSFNDDVLEGLRNPTGKRQYFSDDGFLKEKRIISEKENHEHITIYHRNGFWEEGYYNSPMYDNRIGTWTKYSKDGQLRKETTYDRDGKVIESKEY